MFLRVAETQSLNFQNVYIFFFQSGFFWMFSIPGWLWFLLFWSTGSRHVGFSSCGSWALEHRLSSWAHELSCAVTGGMSQTRDWTSIPCIGRWILIFCTREVWPCSFYFNKYLDHIQLCYTDPNRQFLLVSLGWYRFMSSTTTTRVPGNRMHL